MRGKAAHQAHGGPGPDPLTQLSPTLDQMYAQDGRASIPPEHLLKACLLMALFSVRSERQFCERLEYDLLFKWFLDLNIMDHSFDHSVFAKNRQRLLDADVAREFLLEIVEQAREQRLLSEEHFSVDGTLLEGWASVKSFRPRDEEPLPGDGGRNPEVDFHGERPAMRPTGPPRTQRPGWPGRAKARNAAVFRGSRADGQSGGSGGRRAPHTRQWDRGAGRRAGDAGVSAGIWTHHRGRGPWLRYQGFRQGVPEDAGNTPRGAAAALGH